MVLVNKYFIIVVDCFQNSLRIQISINEMPVRLHEFSQTFAQIADYGYSIKRK